VVSLVLAVVLDGSVETSPAGRAARNVGSLTTGTSVVVNGGTGVPGSSVPDALDGTAPATGGPDPGSGTRGGPGAGPGGPGAPAGGQGGQPGGPSGGQPTTGPTPSAGAPPSSASCGVGQDGYAAIAGGRRVLVRAPATTQRRPAVVVLHGYTGVPERIEAQSGWTPFALGQGAVVAYPEGTPVGAGGYGWNTGTARFSTAGVDDVAYLAAVVDHLVATACVDPARILLTGESNGGAMTVAAACAPATATRFALFAPVIPAVDQGVLDRCGGGPAVRLVALAGRLDRVIPYDGVYPPGQVPLLGQETWFLRLAATRNGCGSGEPSREPIDGAQVVRPSGCPGGPTLLAIDDGTHTWPGGAGTPTQPAGRFPATAYLWGTFVGR
jgi:polyhydroxybutyrate depolymerase